MTPHDIASLVRKSKFRSAEDFGLVLSALSTLMADRCREDGAFAHRVQTPLDLLDQCCDELMPEFSEADLRDQREWDRADAARQRAIDDREAA